jgi:hypothetical protein
MVCPSYGRSLQPSKDGIEHFKKLNLLTFFYVCVSFFALLDPDPIRIHNTAWCSLSMWRAGGLMFDI